MQFDEGEVDVCRTGMYSTVRERWMATIYYSLGITISKITLRFLKQASSTDTVLCLMSARPVSALREVMAKISDGFAQGYTGRTSKDAGARGVLATEK